MSFKSNDNQQMTLYDAVFGLTDSEKRMLEKSRPNKLLVRAFSFEKNTGKVKASFNKNNVRTFISKISAAPGFRIKPEIA